MIPKWVKVCAALLFAFYLFTQPVSAGNAVKDAAATVGTYATNLITFISTVLS